MEFIGNLIAGAYKAFLVFLTTPGLWIHQGKPVFPIFFGIILLSGVIALSSRIVWMRSGQTNAVAFRVNKLIFYFMMALVVYVIACIPFMG